MYTLKPKHVEMRRARFSSPPFKHGVLLCLCVLVCGCAADEDKDNNTITGIGLDSKAEFSESCDAQISAAGRAEELCRDMAREARNKTTTQVVGGTVTAAAYYAAGIGTGVTALQSLQALAFTLGIGTLIGLDITVTTAVAAGVGVGTVGATCMATHCIANEFDKIRESTRRAEKELWFTAGNWL